MSFAADKSANVRGEVATLARHIRSRVLNCSAGGCLLETTAPVAVGSTGKLRVTLEAAHNRLHQQMHRQCVYHQHTPIHDHTEHHEH